MIILGSIIYTTWLTFYFKIPGGGLDPLWMGYYYFNLWSRCCVYFIGVLVALMMLKPSAPVKASAPAPRPQAGGTETPTDAKIKFGSTVVGGSRFPSGLRQGSGLTAPSLPYDLTPSETETSRKIREQKQEARIMGTFWIGVLCLGTLIFSAWSLHYYFQLGRDQSGIPLWVASIQTNFGKMIFVTIVMVLLMSVCDAIKSFPKMIANSGSIQLVGQVSFGIYCWHLAVLANMGPVLPTWAPPLSNYYFWGQFMAVFFYSFWLSIWSTCMLELPCGDLWRILEIPTLKLMKNF